MKFYPTEQRSDAWREMRLGRPTASNFHRIVSPTGRPSAQAPLYAAELISERIFNAAMLKDISGIPAVRHGIETEPEAAETLSGMLGVDLLPGGFMTDDKGLYGCSPDRLLISGNRRELVEIKCPYEIPIHVRNLLYGPSDDYKVQVQGQLLVSGFDAVHFLSYHQDCPPCYVRVERDQKFIDVLERMLADFCGRLEIDYVRALKMGEWGEARR